MQGQINPKIVGATVIGFALVAGAYTLTNFSKPQQANTQPAAVKQAADAPVRVAIPVTDADNNGLEDWRDEFFTTPKQTTPTIAHATYTPPDTLSGQTGIDFMVDVIRNKMLGPAAQANEYIIDKHIDRLEKVSAVTLYDTKDISVLEEWGDEDIVNYANTLATIFISNSDASLDHELDILVDITQNGNTDRTPELTRVAEVYAKYRDDALLLPVPKEFAKEHLDLINTSHAVSADIEAMTQINNDPMVTLLRLKRYDDDIAGLVTASKNMFLALEPHADLFTVEDPAVFFILFSPDLQRQ